MASGGNAMMRQLYEMLSFAEQLPKRVFADVTRIPVGVTPITDAQ